MSEQHRVPLSVWISSSSLSDDDYLIPALRAACSLADQICKAEEAGQSPTPSSDWIGSIIVRGNGRLSATDTDDDSFEIEKLLFGTEEECGEVDTNKNSIRVEILPSLLNTTDTRQTDGGIQRQRIHSLGLVFYEIFSRGERPAELEPQQQAGEKSKESQQEYLEDSDPLPFDQVAAPIDVTGLVSTLDHEVEDENNLKDPFPVDRDGWVDLDLGGEPLRSIFDDVPIPDEYNIQENASNLVANPRKKRLQSCKYNLCAVSVEPLNAKGIPRSLCDLIANMMDCDNDIHGGEDAFQNMSQVRSDLQLMLDKPAIYLYDQDMGSLETTGLQRCVAFFGRNAELSTIMDAYRRSVSGDNESVTIFGPSGSGKTFLAFEIGKRVIAEKGVFLYGKFDQLQQGKPFSALASAFDQFCGMIINNNDGLNMMRQQVECQVRSVLGREAYHLTKIIPNLAIILGPEPLGFDDDENCVNAQRRLQYLLCRFVEVISISVGASVPMILCLDDLQWADASSIAAVKQLLSIGGPSSQKTPFFFLGCYREGEVGNCNPLWEVICNGDFLEANSTKVKLSYMDEETVNTMVSETLCLSLRLTRALSSIIHRKTKGNPLFVSRLMLLLRKEGLLRPSLSRRRWEWDEEKIRCQKLPDDVAVFLTHSIGMMPETVKSSLCVMSCFGASVESATIKILEGVFHKNLLDNLDVAVAEGLLDKKDDQYHFTHDRIQEAAYNLMVRDRCHFHFQYGMALASPCIENEDDDGNLFTAVNQLNLGGPEVIQYEFQIVIVASLNLRAGKKSIHMSDFEMAYWYFDKGITFLRKKHWHWTEHYDLSLELFVLASKCALFKGDIAGFGFLAEQVMKNTTSFEDKLNVLYFSMCEMASSSRLTESIEKGLKTLAKLGIVLGGFDSSMEACLQETKDFLSGHTGDEILNSKQMTDPTIIMAMKFLGKLEMGMSQIMPRSVPSVTQKIIQLSLLHGLSPVSPIGFVHFGSSMAKLGDISRGYYYVKLALSLLDKVGSRESAGEVIAIATQVRTYVEPIQAALEYHNDGYAAAMTSGDANMASLNRVLFFASSFFVGVNLHIVLEKSTETRKMMEERKQVIFLVQHQQVQRSIFKLTGTAEESKYVSEEQILLATNNSVLVSYHFHEAYNSFMFRSYDDTKECAEKYFACRGNSRANLLFAEAASSFYAGLMSFWIARKSREERQMWYDWGNKCEVALKRWTESSRWTFENKWYLLQAEEAYCNDDLEAAKSFYKKAISSAREHKFVNEEALAYELAAYFYLEIGDMKESIGHFFPAHEKYQEWGALEKSDSLFKFIEKEGLLLS